MAPPAGEMLRRGEERQARSVKAHEEDPGSTRGTRMRMRGARWWQRFHLFFAAVCLLCASASACTGKIDLIICMDASGSIGFQDYITVQNFAQDFIEEFSSSGKSFNGDEGLKVGVFMFASSNVKLTSNPDLTADYDVARAAPKKKRRSGGTSPEDCFDDARASFKSASGGARADSTKLVLLITDGEPNSPTKANAASANLIKDGVLILGVGVAVGSGPNADKKIKDMISKPVDQNYVYIDDFDKMKAQLADITKMVCPIDCEGVWSDWSACDPGTGTRSRTFVVSKQAADGGDSCPPPETESCDIDCGYSYSGWSECGQAKSATSAFLGPWEQVRTVTTNVARRQQR